MSQHVTYSQLEEVFHFTKHLSEQEKKLLLDNIYTVSYEAGKVLLEDGFSCVNAFFVLKGSIRVLKLSEDGREVTLYRIRAGETCLMTVSCIMADYEFQAVARVEEATELIILPANIFKEMLSQSPQFLQYIFERTLVRLKDVMQVVEKVTFDSIKKRIALFLHDSLITSKENPLRITHEQIAFEIGTAREVVSRTLNEMAADQILKLSRGTVHVLDAEELKEIIVS